jgi:hypothetical protein
MSQVTEESGKGARRHSRDGLSILLLGAAIFLLCGVGFQLKLRYAFTDFKGVYFSTQCLIDHCDPYSPAEITARMGTSPLFIVPGHPGNQLVIAHCVYLPTAFGIVAPFALLPFAQAAFLWQIAGAGMFLFAAFLVWRMSPAVASLPAAVLVAALLVNSIWLFLIGNSAMLSTGLCIAAIWMLIEKRHEYVGVLLLALSLMLKPHNTGLIWLYFLLAGGLYRKRARQAFVWVLVLSIPTLVWVSAASPHWLLELKANKDFFAVHGGMDDPGPASGVGSMIDAVVELQSVLSVFWDNPHFYNPVAYLLCGVLLLVWIAATRRLPATPQNVWLALAAASALTLLPLYHRQHDARLILLCIPACVSLWAARGKVGWAALTLTSAAIVLTGDIASALRIAMVEPWLERQAGLMGSVLTVLFGRPAQLSLFCLAVFYLWVYARRALAADAKAETA